MARTAPGGILVNLTYVQKKKNISLMNLNIILFFRSDCVCTRVSACPTVTLMRVSDVSAPLVGRAGLAISRYRYNENGRVFQK